MTEFSPRAGDRQPGVPHPAYLLGRLTGAEWLQLQEAAIQGEAWNEYIRTEREKRAEAIAVIQAHDPGNRPVGKEYDETAGPRAYLADLRTANNGTGKPEKLADTQRFKVEEQILRGWSHRMTKDVIYGKDATDTPENAFVANSVNDLFLHPITRSLQAHETAYKKTIRDRLPVYRTELGHTAAGVDFNKATGEKLHQTAEALQKVPFTIGPSDFFQLTPEQQSTVMAEVEQEVELVKSLIGADRMRLRQRHAWGPLAFVSAKELDEVLSKHHSLREEVIATFLDHPYEFRQRYGSRVVNLPNQEAANAISPDIMIELGQSENGKRIRQLILLRGVKPALLEAEPNQRIDLTKPDEKIPFTDFDDLIEAHTEVVARMLAETELNPETANVPIRWSRTQVQPGEEFRGGHYGRLANLSMYYQEVTAEELEKQYHKRYDPAKHRPDKYLRVVFEADFKAGASTQRSKYSLLVSTTRNHAGQLAIQKISQGRKRDRRTQQSLAAEAAENAKKIEAFGLRHTAQGGAGETGKHSLMRRFRNR